MVDVAKNSGVQAKKQAYAAPTLTVFGSVRELTGGVSGTNGDGTAMNQS